MPTILDYIEKTIKLPNCPKCKSDNIKIKRYWSMEKCFKSAVVCYACGYSPEMGSFYDDRQAVNYWIELCGGIKDE